MEVKDLNSNLLADGDSVVVMKTLKVRGSSLQVKKGTVVRRIRLMENDEEADWLRTFLKA
ncbi:PhnA domain-containing protein [Pedobacter sp. ISL-68]|uniref:PhnA domain-containing protein n=1 Tax=unclassified Pedobacter TaxID=2628915 RepID=UPI001BECABF1|nr:MULTISPECIES: PhnA domain-containing protein [unclassified Pedobacter]MBT2560895.1 PhnA domain-containing protein [Pedobacter sp. ISL-64]MBT2590285.1 PhnA domain-containing protein [Pedobacter sp. ISL-68]